MRRCIDHIDGRRHGSIEIMKVRELADGAIEMLTSTTAGGDAFIQHSLGVPRNMRSLDNAISDNAFISIPHKRILYYGSRPKARCSWQPYDTFGFELSPNGY